MPQRTNEFQELVTLIQKALAPKGAKITSSAMVKVAELETMREVDVLIESELGAYNIKLAVEAKDETRKLSLIQFDSLVNKYRGECRVLVDKFVIVSRAGFTKGVVEKAKATDVELLTLDQAKKTDWTKLAPGTLTYSMPPHICSINFTPPIEVGNIKEIWHNARLFCPHGHDHGTPMERAKHLVFHKYFREHPEFVQDFMRQIQESVGGEGRIHAEYNHPQWIVKHGGQQFLINQMEFVIHAINTKTKLDCKEWQLNSSKGGSKLLRHYEAIAGGKKMQLMFPSGGRPDKLILKIESALRNAEKRRSEHAKQSKTIGKRRQKRKK